MSNYAKQIQDYLKQLDFDADATALYLTLFGNGAMSLSQLARESGVERTRTYRVLEQLKEAGLVEVEIRYKRNVYRAAPISNLRSLLAKQEQRLKGLQAQLDSLEQLMPATELTSAATRVQFYQGPDGVKQMLWNQTRARSSVYAILHRNIQLETGESFFERWVQRRNDSGVMSYGLVGDNFLAEQKKWYGDEQGTSMTQWEPRYISPKDFPITHNQIVYDNVVAFYNWKDEEVFGVEIYNKEIATAQRYFFKAYWHMAKPLTQQK